MTPSARPYVPKGAEILWNDRGTAPGLHFGSVSEGPLKNRRLFLLPGPPSELKPMFQEKVLPILRRLFPIRQKIECRIYKAAGVPESEIGKLLGVELESAKGVELGYCAKIGELDIRCIGTAEDLDQIEGAIIEKLGNALVSTNGDGLEHVLIKQLRGRKETLTTAESCTGGLLANSLTDVPGASEVFLQGLVTYSNTAKEKLLAVPAQLLEAYGAVSEEVARAMAEGALAAANADHALSTTGIAGPGGGTESKPVGTVYIALASKERETIVERHYRPTDRETFKRIVSQKAFNLLRLRLLEC